MSTHVDGKKIAQEGLACSYPFSISRKDFEESVENELRRRGQNLKLQGFRPGKVPLALVNQRIGKDVRHDILNQQLGEIFRELAAKEDLNIFGEPSYKLDQPLEDSSNQSLSGTLLFNKYPQAPEMDVEALKKDLPPFQEADPSVLNIFEGGEGLLSYHFSLTDVFEPVTDQDVNGSLEKLAQNQRETASIQEDRSAQKGDTLIYRMEYILSDGGKKEQEGRLTLGGGQFPEEFEDNLLGKKKEEVLSEKLRVPKQFPDPDLAGKKVTFKITILDIQEPLEPKVDEALAKRLGETSLEGLKKTVKQNLEKSKEENRRFARKAILGDFLASKLDFDVPEEPVKELARGSIGYQLAVKAGLSHGFSQEEKEAAFQKAFGKDEEKVYEEAEAKARKHWRLFFFAEKVAKEAGVQLSKEEVDRAVRLMDNLSSGEGGFSQFLADNPKERSRFFRRLLMLKVFDQWEPAKSEDDKSTPKG